MKINYLASALTVLTLLFVFSSCEKEDQDVSVKDLYFEANLSGKSLYLPEGKDGYQSKAEASSIGNGAGCVRIQSMGISKGDPKKSVEVFFVKPQSDCPTTCTQDAEIITKGTYTFGRMTTTPETVSADGIVVAYTDVDGKVWRTDFGTGQQTNSNFRITDKVENTANGNWKYYVKAEFDCTLYDGEGNEIEVTDGKIVSRAILCN